jgi:outer membrane protein OmpA-like peptidoglycan-associated protein
MSRMRLTPLTTLLVASVATSVGAQAPAAPETPADSVVADSLKPKKTGRFGGLMNKAKSVAGNKKVQAAVKAAGSDAVKGAAVGVACTVVPGAAVASAVSGQGPCANSGIMGMVSGKGVGGTAAAMAAGAASNGASGLAAKAMGKGGVVGAATAGALGGMGGMGGLSNAAATAAALKMMKGGASSGVSNAATAAAYMQMMQAQGMSNAAAAAAMRDAGMTSANMAAAMKMMQQSNNAEMAAAMQMMQSMGASSGGAPASKTSGSTAAPSTAAAPVLWTNYDFVPGERVIYYADFTDDQVGNFPARLQFVEGNMEVAELGGRRVLRATSQSKLSIPLPEVLPQRFTIEIDVINRPSLDGADFHLRGTPGRIDDAKTSIIAWGSDGVAMLGGGGGEVRLSNNEANRARYRGKPAQVRILGDGKYIKVYLDEKRLANVPNANFDRSKLLHLVVDARTEENSAYISRIRVAESRKSIYDDLMAAGHTATQGLLFDTGSDRLKPESTPTLKQIAAMLEQHPELKLRIEGHTDNVGSKDTNRALSEKRAASVKAALIKDYKTNGGRLESKGFGDTKPAGANDTAEGRSNNRRVELVKI